LPGRGRACVTLQLEPLQLADEPHHYAENLERPFGRITG
jgi:hypothetical protein